MQTVGTLTIKPTPLVRETAYSMHRLGKLASTMTLYADGPSYFIEWDIPGLDECERIGLVFEHNTLADYDGVFSLPKEAVRLIRECGFVVPAEFVD